jgi:hypothetical protein
MICLTKEEPAKQSSLAPSSPTSSFIAKRCRFQGKQMDCETLPISLQIHGDGSIKQQTKSNPKEEPAKAKQSSLAPSSPTSSFIAKRRRFQGKQMDCETLRISCTSSASASVSASVSVSVLPPPSLNCRQNSC